MSLLTMIYLGVYSLTHFDATVCYGYRAIFSEYCDVSCVSTVLPVNSISQWNNTYATFAPTVRLWQENRFTSEEEIREKEKK